MERTIPTTFATAVSWLNNAIIRCNEIPNIDPSVIDNARFKLYPYYEDEDGEEFEESSDYSKFIEEKFSDRIEELQEKRTNGTITLEEKQELDSIMHKIDYPHEHLEMQNNEVMQWYLTNCSEDDVRYLENAFGLTFTYSDLLNLYVLAVFHWGTSWDYVYWTTNNPNAECELGKHIK